MEDPYNNMEPADFFNLLESNQPTVVEEIKSLIHEHLNSTKEAWLVQGLFDYSFSKSSLRAMEVLLSLRESHSKHLFDKLSESLRSGATRLSALIFMGFLVRRQPQWLHKISSHYVMKDLIKVLKTDGDVVVLVNALLVLTALIPIIPNLEAFILNDIFEGFSRLAAWNYSHQPKQPEVYVLHLQIALYALFHRLYGMYPCNFLSYLRQHYSARENLPIFSHTVKPMVETVRMHPLLVTASKDIEIGTARWKQMSVHDIVTECAKYSLLECQEMGHREELVDQDASNSCAIEPAVQPAPWLVEAMNVTGEWTHPLAQWIQSSSSSSSVQPVKMPLSTRTLTPKVEPTELLKGQSTQLPVHSSVARTLTLTPTASPQSQNPLPPSALPPTSPMKKDLHSFKFPGAGEHDRRSTVIGVKLQKIGQEPSNSFAHFGPVLSGMRSRHSSGAPNADPRKNLASPAAMSDPLNTPPPSAKPTDHISAEDREVSRLLSTGRQSGPSRTEGEKESHALSQSWVQSRDGTPSVITPSRPDSLLQDKIEDRQYDDAELEGWRTGRSSTVRDFEDDNGDDVASCQSGGLHMPDQWRISDFVQRVKRLRYFSQCPNPNQGSPGSGSSIGTVVEGSGSYGQTGSASSTTGPPASTSRTRRKRSNSCPNLLLVPSMSDVSDRTTNQVEVKEVLTPANLTSLPQQSTASQTDQDLWPPTPYEHLFFSVLPPSLLFPPPPAPVEGPARPLAPSELLDRYIDAAFRNHERTSTLLGKTNANEDVTLLKGQVLMLQSQLQFERHRREVHAERNRRLLAKAKGLGLIEGELQSLRLQLVQAQNEMAALRRDGENLRRQRHLAETERNQSVHLLEQRTKQMMQELQDLTAIKNQREEDLQKALKEVRTLRRETDQINACLFDADAEMVELRRRANDSHRYQQNLKDSQFHLIAARETANMLQQQLMNPTSGVAKFELEELTRSFKEEVKAQSEKLERERRQNEALTARLVDMEATGTRRETDLSELKRQLQAVKEEHQQVMQVSEQKYESIKSVNVALENCILQLRHQVESLKSRQSRRRQIQQQDSMTASSAVSPTTLAGFSASPSSPHSFSPLSGASMEQLSVSLAVEASEGLYWQGIETSVLTEESELPYEETALHGRRPNVTITDSSDQRHHQQQHPVGEHSNQPTTK